MTFSIKKSPEYSWPVTVEIPIDGKRHEKSTFDVKFKRIPQSRIREIGAAVRTGEMNDDREVAKEVVVGWSGVLDESGQQLPFSESSFSNLVDIPGVAAAIVEAFFGSIAGAQRKN